MSKQTLALRNKSIQILQAVGLLGIATTEMIHRYLYSGRHQATTSSELKALEDQGLIWHHNYSPKQQGQAIYLYRLTKEGHRFLQYGLKIPSNQLTTTTQFPDLLKSETVPHL